MQRVADNTGLRLKHVREVASGLQLLDVQDDQQSAPETVAARLRQDPNIADAIPDRWLRLHETVPNDPAFSIDQSYMGSPSQAAGAADITVAWDRMRGSSAVVVAVVDTGYQPHADLAARLVPGYDFIIDDTLSQDGQLGRDGDATDPGDYIPVGFVCPGTTTPQPIATDSSWHGTSVASIIGALTNNGGDIAGVDWNARIQPVRVAGRCGALLSDAVDGMRWAAGPPVPGVPVNPTPAKVVNVSLGGGTCSSIEQQTVNDLAALGVVVIAAAGNTGGAVEAPADCNGVIAVTEHVNDGEHASYGSVGPQVTLSALGGGCGVSKALVGACSVLLSWIATLSNSGQTTPGASFAAPMVSGVVALMFAMNATLTPAQIVGALQRSARPNPVNTYCATNPGTCGVGLLDAAAALTAIVSPPPRRVDFCVGTTQERPR
jgi:serine protease